MAEHDDHDKHDDHAAGSGRGEESVKRADDPPTLPPFASDGPRPNTIHGFPAAEVFGDGLGDGGLGDLFDVPKLGARTESPPVPKAAPPLVRPLASRTGLKAPTGPVPIIPQSPAIKAPAAQAPVAQAPASDARNEPIGREPTSGSQHDFTEAFDGDGGGDRDGDRGPAKPTSLPSATSLIEKIRAAKRKEAEQAEQADAAEPTIEPKPQARPEPKPEAKPTPEHTSVVRPVAAKIQPRTAPPQPPANRPPPPKPPSSTVAAEPEPAPPKPSSSTEPEPEPKPAPPKPPSSTVVAAEPKPLESAVETVKLQVPAAEADKPEQAPDDNKVWLEPVPLASLDRRHSGPIPTPSTDASPAAAPRTDAPSTTDTPPVEPVESSAATALPIPPLPTEPDEHDGERTIAFNKPSGRVGNPLPAPPASKPVLAPPPSTSAGHAEHQPKVGAPYVPPALVLERSDDVPTSEPITSEELPSPDHDTEVARPRAALPIPGNWRPPHEAMNPITAARLASGVAEPMMDAQAEAEAVPERITAQDTASLVNGLADELIAEHEPAANSAALANAGDLDSDDDESTFPAARRRKYALYFLGVAAVLSLIVALLPSKETAKDTEPTPEVAKAPEPEPDPTDPSLLAEAQPPEPEPAPEDSLPASDTKTGGDAEAVPEPEPQPLASTKPKSKSQQPKPESEPASKPQPKSQPKLEPKPQPKPPAPTPGGPDDKRSADELYDAAKAAYNSGRAAEAYKLAYASWRKKDKSKTAELMTLAACKLKDKAKAKSSLDKVAGLRRNAIKKDCQGLGLSL